MSLPQTPDARDAQLPPDAPLGPLDGRYRASVAPLAEHLSEAALNRARVQVEVEWLIHLATTGAVPGMRPLSAAEQARLRDVVRGFDGAAVTELAEIERETLHDVKAVEYYLKRPTDGTSLADVAEHIHLFCTSEDINNLAYAARMGNRPLRPPSARSWRCWPTGCAGNCAGSSPPNTWARSTAPPARSQRTSWVPRPPTGRLPASSGANTRAGVPGDAHMLQALTTPSQ